MPQSANLDPAPRSVAVARTSLFAFAAISFVLTIGYAANASATSLFYAVIAMAAAAVAVGLRPGSRPAWLIAVIVSQLNIFLTVMLGLFMLVELETSQAVTVTCTVVLFALAVCASTALMAPRARRYLQLAASITKSV